MYTPESLARIIAQITISFLIISLSSVVLAEPIPYRAVYKASFQGLPFSIESVRQLSREENGTYRLTSTAKSFFASIKEYSNFKIQDSQVIPLQYQYHRSGIGRTRDAILDFDWDNNKVLNNIQSKLWEMVIPQGTLDKLLYQFKVREDLILAKQKGLPWPSLKYQIADGGRLKTFEFEIVGEEQLETPIGLLETIKITRVKHRRNRTTTFWLASDYDFLLVRILQIEDGKGFDMILKHAEIGGQRIQSKK